MQLFYHPDLQTDFVQLSEEESKHLVKVLRKRVGDTLQLIDGKGMEAIARITQVHPKRVSCEIEGRTQRQRNRNYWLHLAIAPTKNAERMDWLVEKATEIGVDRITFIETTRGERNRINLERLQRIAVSAIKQSKQFYLPELQDLTSLQNILESKDQTSQSFLCWCEAGKELQLLHQLQAKKNQRILILIGPEGDFTEEEVQQSIRLGCKPVSLGNTILRTETAALVAVVTVATKVS